MSAKQVSNVGTGKLNEIDHKEEWGGNPSEFYCSC